MAYSFDNLCSNLIPTGKYKVQVTDIKFKTNSLGECSKDMVVNYTIVDGPYAKKTLVDTIYEKSFSFRLKPFLVACKVDTAREFASAEELYKFGLTSAKGKIIMIDIGIRTYNSKEYNQVSNFYPLPDSTTTADEVLKEFGESPEVKTAAALEDILGDTKVEDTPKAAEPELDIDLDLDNLDDNPF